MKILIVLGHNRFTGVNSWAYTLIKYLAVFGYTVDVEIKTDYNYVPHYHDFITCLSRVANDIHINYKVDYNGYDVAIVSYSKHEKEIYQLTPYIFVCHGAYFADYTPNLSPNCVVSVSERIREKIGGDKVITNGVDLNFFSLSLSTSSTIKRILYNNRYAVPTVIKQLENDFDVIYTNGKFTFDHIKQLINSSDVVIGYGRSIYEAMSSGKPAFVCGYVEDEEHICLCDGWITPNDFKDLFRNNCNGSRKLNYIQDNAVLKDLLISGYNTDMGVQNRILAEQYLNGYQMAFEFNLVIRQVLNNGFK